MNSTLGQKGKEARKGLVISENMVESEILGLNWKKSYWNLRGVSWKDSVWWLESGQPAMKIRKSYSQWG